MKRLEFEAGDNGQQLFSDLYGAFQIGERYLQGVKAVRSAIKVYDGFYAISDTVKAVNGDTRKLLLEGGAMDLENEEFDTLKAACTKVLDQGLNAMSSATQMSYRTLDARRAGVLLDFLDGAKDVPVVAAVPKPDAESAPVRLGLPKPEGK